MQNRPSRYFPTTDKLGSPRNLLSVFQQVLTQHYKLRDDFDKYRAANPPSTGEKKSGPPLGSGPTDTQICGLFVQPVDTSTLADGATLKFDKKSGTFHFV